MSVDAIENKGRQGKMKKRQCSKGIQHNINCKHIIDGSKEKYREKKCLPNRTVT